MIMGIVYVTLGIVPQDFSPASLYMLYTNSDHLEWSFDWFSWNMQDHDTFTASLTPGNNMNNGEHGHMVNIEHGVWIWQFIRPGFVRQHAGAGILKHPSPLVVLSMEITMVVRVIMVISYNGCQGDHGD